MSDTPTIEAYLAAVGAELRDVPRAEREDALAELRSLLHEEALRSGEGDAVAALGDPRAYARQVRLALGRSAGEADDLEPQGRVLGMPYDFRGASVERISARVWNPADPRIFTPRLFGVGWTINFGAIAVRLGLIRPDDIGEESFERIPVRAVRMALAVPLALAVATTALMVYAWGSLPAEVPVHWNAGGVPDDWAPKWLALGGLFALTVLPVLITVGSLLAGRANARSRVLSAAALGLIASIGLGLAAFTVADADGGNAGRLIWLVIVGGIVLSFLLLYVPSRMGLRAEWREAAGREEGK